MIIRLVTTCLSRIPCADNLDGKDSVRSCDFAWAKEMTRAYNGIKHANRDLPEELDLLNRWMESVVVVRAWVARELGVQPEAVKRRLELDPNAARFRARA